MIEVAIVALKEALSLDEAPDYSAKKAAYEESSLEKADGPEKKNITDCHCDEADASGRITDAPEDKAV